VRSALALAALLPRICAGCQDVVPLAVTASVGTFYLGWICPRCVATDTEGSLLDVLGVYATPEDADQDLLSEEYHASPFPPAPMGLADGVGTSLERAVVTRADLI
jgi:hypothetical protein